MQRPASVVKELLENAVDAGADNISVIISDAGRTLIQVIDNGRGMSPEEAVLCFERHATSKIANADDLMNIGTFGFRGEALASIAAVAEVVLKTRRAEDELACEVRFADSNLRSTGSAAAPVGCNFAVRNLFYNVPARRKFLKSDNVEFRHIVSEFTRVALTRPDISFSLVHNGRDVFRMKPAMSLKFRIQDLLGSTVANEIVDVAADTSVVKLSGFVGRPDLARKSLGNQFFFVNGRYFRSPYLHKAVMKAYENLITEGVTPSYFLYLEIDPQTVDVNIHPTKTEIKFEDESVIFQIIYAAVKEQLGKNSFGESIDFDREGAPDIPVFSRNFADYRPIAEPSVGIDSAYNPFDNDGFPSEAPGKYTNPSFGDEFRQFEFQADTKAYQGHTAPYVSKADNYGKLFEESVLSPVGLTVLHNKYILSPVKSGLMLINIRRAKERILYEKFLKAMSDNAHISQTALFPVSAEVGAENVPLFEEHAELLASLGFDIAVFGTDTIVVNGVPEGYSVEEDRVRTMIGDLILVLNDNHASLAVTMLSALAERFARIGASGESSPVSGVEAQNLINALFACENSEFTSAGHRTMTILSVDEIDKKFN